MTMLNAIGEPRVNNALAMIGHTYRPDEEAYTTTTARRLILEPTCIQVQTRWGDWDVIWDAKEDEVLPNRTLVEAIKAIYGGALDDVVKIEVFGQGYTVETRTPVIDADTNTYVRETRVGLLVLGNKKEEA